MPRMIRGITHIKTNMNKNKLKGMCVTMKETAKRKKRLPWWGIVLIVLLCVVIVFLGGSYGAIRYFVGDSLGWRGTLAMVGYGGMDLPDWVNKFILDGDRSYKGLPELLVDSNGNAVDTIEKYQDRRAEILDLYETYMYGHTPTEGFDVAFTEVETDTALNGAAQRHQIKITVTTDKGSCESMLLVYLPIADQPCGVFIGENFSGNTTVWNDENILPSPMQNQDAERGSDSSWPVDLIISRGYGVATLYYGDWAADSEESYRELVMSLFEDENSTAFTAWSFGLMRGIDYLCSMDDVDKDLIATIGHSRLARVSLWTGAIDPRVTLVTGSCGGGYLRSPIASKITENGTSDHWNTPAYFSYYGRDEELPVDTHMMIALIADRHVFISIGESDLASDPVSMYDSLQNAKSVWHDIYGVEVIPDGSYYDLPEDAVVMSEGMGVNVHTGGHWFDQKDWNSYMDYMDQYLG